MAENVRSPGPVTRFYRWLAGYFRAVIDPTLSMRVRIISGCERRWPLLGALGLALLCAYAVILIPFTPSIADLRKAKIDQPSVLISADGKRLATLKPMNREWVRLNQISPHVINALIATEDHRFYQHYGIDLLRTATGILRIVHRRSGGRFHAHPATRAQSVSGRHRPQADDHAENKRDDHRDQNRIRLHKKEILETYLNTMPFLYNAFGIEMAARTYFDKPAQKLNVIESATLDRHVERHQLLQPGAQSRARA